MKRPPASQPYSVESLHFPELMEVVRLYLDGVPKLKNLDGFLQVSRMTSLNLRRSGLTNLAGLGATHLATLCFTENNELVTLAGLESLQGVDSMKLIANERLENLEGLKAPPQAILPCIVGVWNAQVFGKGLAYGYGLLTGGLAIRIDDQALKDALVARQVRQGSDPTVLLV